MILKYRLKELFFFIFFVSVCVSVLFLMFGMCVVFFRYGFLLLINYCAFPWIAAYIVCFIACSSVATICWLAATSYFFKD